MLAVALAIMAILVVILKSGLRSISKKIKSLMFLNIFTPQQHALTHTVFFVFKIIDKTNSKFCMEIEEALHINWINPNLIELQNFIITM